MLYKTITKAIATTANPVELILTMEAEDRAAAVADPAAPLAVAEVPAAVDVPLLLSITAAASKDFNEDSSREAKVTYRLLVLEFEQLSGYCCQQQ